MKRNKFSLSNTKLLSCDMGEIVPIGLTEVLAGDSIQQSTSALVRAAPLLSPVMHPVHVNIHHWFVPHRLVWEDWESFITGGSDGMDASVFPTIESPAVTGFDVGSLGDYLGVPTGIPGLEVSALPFRAYALVYNEWYRDQDLVTPLTIDTGSGPDTTTSTVLQVGAWEKDYFTTSRPWEQKGPAITIPLGTNAPVTGIGVKNSPNANNTSGLWEANSTTSQTFANSFSGSAGSDLHFKMQGSGAAGSSNKPQIFADLSNASAVTVNVLREALALQRYEEARARYGSRYIEYLRYLGVRSSDARLQRPEYLEAGKKLSNLAKFCKQLKERTPSERFAGMEYLRHAVNAFAVSLKSTDMCSPSASSDPKQSTEMLFSDTGTAEQKKTTGKKNSNTSANKRS